MNIGEMIKKHHLLILGGAVVIAGAYWYNKNKAGTSTDTVSAATPAATTATGSSSFTGYANADSLTAAAVGTTKSAMAIPTLKSLQGMTCAQLTQQYNYWMGVQNNKNTSVGGSGSTTASNTSATTTNTSNTTGLFGVGVTATSMISCAPCYLDLILSVMQSKGCDKGTSKSATTQFNMGFTGDIES